MECANRVKEFGHLFDKLIVTKVTLCGLERAKVFRFDKELKYNL